MSFVLCDQCNIFLKCDSRKEDCYKRCSDACFDLGFGTYQVYNWWNFKNLLPDFPQHPTVNVADTRIVFEDFSWSATSSSSFYIGTVTDNAF